MQGLFSDVALIGVLELLHISRKTGVLTTDSALPLTLAFQQGEIVEGGILDWLGLDAVLASPLIIEEGSFSFSGRNVTGSPLKPMAHLSADWARASDEWGQICAVIGSPSVVMRGELPGYDSPEGRSVRSLARHLSRPLFEMCAEAAEAVTRGTLQPTGKYAWYGLKLREGSQPGQNARIASVLDGERNMGELVASGYGAGELRRYLVAAIRGGLRFSGSGWVLRDLIWEQERAAGSGQ